MKKSFYILMSFLLMFTFTSNSFLGAQSVQASTQQDIENTLNEMMGNLEKIDRVDTTEEQKLINESIS